eukprot:2638941-Prymnesium_polylepis.2
MTSWTGAGRFPDRRAWLEEFGLCGFDPVPRAKVSDAEAPPGVWSNLGGTCAQVIGEGGATQRWAAQVFGEALPS